jgi:hypothetical protein
MFLKQTERDSLLQFRFLMQDASLSGGLQPATSLFYTVIYINYINVKYIYFTYSKTPREERHIKEKPSAATGD